MANDRAAALAALHGRLLAAYSDRTIAALRAALATRLALPYIEPVLKLNVEKEIRKDAIVARYAARAVATGSAPGAELVREIYAEMQTIDALFLASVRDFPVRLKLHYEDIEPVRVSRIRYLLHAAYRVLCAWRAPGSLRAAMREAFAKPDFEVLLAMIFDLYAREARAVWHSVEIPRGLQTVGQRAIQHFGRIMDDAGTALARDVARLVYRSGSARAPVRAAVAHPCH